MKENEEHLQTGDQKRKIRERYKGVSEDELDIIPAIPQEDFYDDQRHKRVAVYARVSTDDPRQTSSYELQKNHYTDMVNRRPDWDLVDIYADEGISGTSLQHRDSFIRMIEDCKAGKIDLIVTKSVSRFARNVLDCIGYVRQLKALNPPIGIFFETENIYTLAGNSEMSLSFIATLAQEESHNKSEIMNSSIEMRFKRGIFLTPVLLGYDQDEEGNLIINEEEAKIVRLIFFLYLYGYSTQKIAEELTRLHLSTKRGNTVWSPGSVLQILQNERHCGDVLARKTFTPNYLDHKSKKNNHDRNQYRMKNHHESIVSRDDFIAVQHMIANSRYGAQKFLPSLNVVNEGLLKGFVLINTRWASFSSDDYLAACESLNINPVKNQVLSPGSGEFDLRGFEITRIQFINTARRICVSFTPSNELRWSADAVGRFPENNYVQLYIHPKEKLFAIKPCSKDDPYALRWSKSREGKPVPVNTTISAFMPTLYKMLEWDQNNRYKCLGNLKSSGAQKILLFNLNEVEIHIPKSDLDEDLNLFTSGKNNIIAFPADWSESFGEEVYEHPLTNDGKLLNKTIRISEKSTPYKNNDLNTSSPDTVSKGIHDLITYFRKESEHGQPGNE